MHEREHLPLRGLREYRSGGAPGTAQTVATCRDFNTIKAADAAEEVRREARRQRARNLLAGGTTLIDLMKLDVETPGAGGGYQWVAAGARRRRPRTAG